MKNLKVGLLIPRSAIYPSIGFDVANAFKSGIQHFGGEGITVLTESVGIGADHQEVYTCVERMLLRENVDVLVAYIDHYAAVNIEPLFNAANRLLIVIEPGGTIPDNWDASPLRYHLTLDAAFANTITAKMTDNSNGSTGAFCSTYYDAGYMTCSAMVNKYVANGGSIAYNCIVPFKYEDFDITPFSQAVDELAINTVLANMSIESGAAFLKAYTNAGLENKIDAFLASPFVFEEQFLDTLPFPFAGIKGCVPWGRELNNEANKTFMAAMQDEYGKQGNCFGALAWDAAQFTVLVANALAENKNNALKASAALQNTTMNGVRGLMQLDNNTNYITAPLYNATLVVNENGNSKLQIGEMIDTAADWAAFTSAPMQSQHSRWLNTYLCTT